MARNFLHFRPIVWISVIMFLVCIVFWTYNHLSCSSLAHLFLFKLRAKICDWVFDVHLSSSIPYYRTSTTKQVSAHCCRRCLSPPEPRGALVARQWHTLLSPAAAQAWQANGLMVLMCIFTSMVQKAWSQDMHFSSLISIFSFLLICLRAGINLISCAED